MPPNSPPPNPILTSPSKKPTCQAGRLDLSPKHILRCPRPAEYVELLREHHRFYGTQRLWCAECRRVCLAARKAHADSAAADHRTLQHAKRVGKGRTNA